MNTIKKIGTLVSLLSISTVVAPAATILTFGGPGYVSQGLNYTYTVGGGDSGGNASSGYTNQNLTFWFYKADKQCTVDFAAAKFSLLSVGTYQDITQYTGQLVSKPSFNLVNMGKALSPIPDGWFKVLEIEIDPIYGVPKKFAADFITYDSSGQHTAGSLRWGSNVPVTPINQIIPEVSTSFLFTIVLGLGLCRRRRT